MTIDNLQIAIYKWIDFVFNVTKSLGTLAFTTGSDEVIGVDVDLLGITPGKWIKLASDNEWVEVDSIVDDTTIKLTQNYAYAGGLGRTYYSTNISNPKIIIYGEQDSPEPDGLYLCIHQPFVHRLQDFFSRQDTNSSGINSNRAYWETTISIEEVNGDGSLITALQKKLNYEQVKLELNYLGLVIRRFGEILPIPEPYQDKWVNRLVCDVFVAYVDDDTEDTSYIGDVALINNI